ncbi:MAG: hypothetical protein QGH14_05960, partial [Candidatus Bathyarchaeota archaeon]|nr:hypothetical protein [Candidatus Bathyarchaeota archaeon]
MSVHKPNHLQSWLKRRIDNINEIAEVNINMYVDACIQDASWGKRLRPEGFWKRSAGGAKGGSKFKVNRQGHIVPDLAEDSEDGDECNLGHVDTLETLAAVSKRRGGAPPTESPHALRAADKAGKGVAGSGERGGKGGFNENGFAQKCKGLHSNNDHECFEVLAAEDVITSGRQPTRKLCIACGNYHVTITSAKGELICPDTIAKARKTTNPHHSVDSVCSKRGTPMSLGGLFRKVLALYKNQDLRGLQRIFTDESLVIVVKEAGLLGDWEGAKSRILSKHGSGQVSSFVNTYLCIAGADVDECYQLIIPLEVNNANSYQCLVNNTNNNNTISSSPDTQTPNIANNIQCIPLGGNTTENINNNAHQSQTLNPAHGIQGIPLLNTSLGGKVNDNIHQDIHNPAGGIQGIPSTNVVNNTNNNTHCPSNNVHPGNTYNKYGDLNSSTSISTPPPES